MAHIEWLDKTKKAYQTCYPNQELNINIEFDETTNTPIKLIIYEDDIQEIYVKRYDIQNNQYIYPVDCIRYENTSIKRKQSIFALDGIWQ